MARRIGNLPLAEAPEQLAQSQDRARARAEAKPKGKAKAKAKATARPVWRPFMDDRQRWALERRRQVHRIIDWFLVRRALMSIFPPHIVARILSCWRA